MYRIDAITTYNMELGEALFSTKPIYKLQYSSRIMVDCLWFTNGKICIRRNVAEDWILIKDNMFILVLNEIRRYYVDGLIVKHPNLIRLSDEEFKGLIDIALGLPA